MGPKKKPAHIPKNPFNIPSIEKLSLKSLFLRIWGFFFFFWEKIEKTVSIKSLGKNPFPKGKKKKLKGFFFFFLKDFKKKRKNTPVPFFFRKTGNFWKKTPPNL